MKQARACIDRWTNWTDYYSTVPAVYHNRCISSFLLDAHYLVNHLQHSICIADLPIWPPTGDLELDHLMVMFSLRVLEQKTVLTYSRSFGLDFNMQISDSVKSGDRGEGEGGGEERGKG